MNKHLPLGRLLQPALKREPGKSALIINDAQYTYEQLETESDKLATCFAKAGLKNEPVAFMLPNGFEIVITYLACFKSGAMAMPLNRRYAPPEVDRVLSNSGTGWLIMEADKLELLDSLDLQNDFVEKVFAAGQELSSDYPTFGSLLEKPSGFHRPKHADKTPAVLFYTSGSTGEPKGVVHSHRSVKAIIDSTADALQGVAPADTILVQEPQCHISGFMETFTVLAHGGTVVVQNGFEVDSYLSNLWTKGPV